MRYRCHQSEDIIHRLEHQYRIRHIAGAGLSMAHDYARSFYKSKAWARCRASYIAERQSIDGGLCERCHHALGYIAHHKVAITPANINDPEVTLNHDNLEYLCKACHDEVHGYCGNQKEKPRCEFDENGNPVPRRW